MIGVRTKDITLDTLIAFKTNTSTNKYNLYFEHDPKNVFYAITVQVYSSKFTNQLQAKW